MKVTQIFKWRNTASPLRQVLFWFFSTHYADRLQLQKYSCTSLTRNYIHSYGTIFQTAKLNLILPLCPFSIFLTSSFILRGHLLSQKRNQSGTISLVTALFRNQEAHLAKRVLGMSTKMQRPRPWPLMKPKIQAGRLEWQTQSRIEW